MDVVLPPLEKESYVFSRRLRVIFLGIMAEIGGDFGHLSCSPLAWKFLVPETSHVYGRVNNGT